MLKLLALLAFVALSAHASDVYYSQSATGSGSGADASDCKAVSGISWVSGTTNHLVGTITSPLTVSGDGTAVAPIILLWEPGAIMTSPSWTGQAILVQGSYITIDGGINGVLTATNQNSTSQLGGNGVTVSGSSNVTVQNLAIANIYNKTSTSDLANNAGTAIFLQYNNHVTVNNNTISNAGAGVFELYQGGASETDIQIFKNTISGCNWGVAGGDGNSGAALSNFTIHDNNITMAGPQWDDPNDNNHHNGIYIWCNFDGSSISGLKYFNNVITGFSGKNSTSFMFLSGVSDTSHGVEGTLIYNNLLVASDAGPDDGMIYVSCDGFQVFNNTIVCLTSAQGGTAINEFTGGEGAPTTGTIQNNILYNWVNAIYTSAGQGVTTLTQSNNLQNVNPLFIGADNFGISIGSPAIGAGVNLSNLFTTDITGFTRVNWDIGAYAYRGAPAPTPTPTPVPTPTPTPVPTPTPTPVPAPGVTYNTWTSQFDARINGANLSPNAKRWIESQVVGPNAPFPDQ